MHGIQVPRPNSAIVGIPFDIALRQEIDVSTVRVDAGEAQAVTDDDSSIAAVRDRNKLNSLISHPAINSGFAPLMPLPSDGLLFGPYGNAEQAVRLPTFTGFHVELPFGDHIRRPETGPLYLTQVVFPY